MPCSKPQAGQKSNNRICKFVQAELPAKLILQLWWQIKLEYIDGLVQERCNSCASAMESHLSCINPSICYQYELMKCQSCKISLDILNNFIWLKIICSGPSEGTVIAIYMYICTDRTNKIWNQLQNLRAIETFDAKCHCSQIDTAIVERLNQHLCPVVSHVTAGTCFNIKIINKILFQLIKGTSYPAHTGVISMC